jgi:hypothetical protein
MVARACRQLLWRLRHKDHLSPEFKVNLSNMARYCLQKKKKKTTTTAKPHHHHPTYNNTNKHKTSLIFAFL